MKFDEKYTEYWQQRVKSNLDGYKVPDNDLFDHYISFLNITSGDKVLDIGCSYGRFFPIIAKYSDYVAGVDIEPNAITQCGKLGYSLLDVCKMEQTNFKSNEFDKLVCWGTFDVVEQKEGLIEANRIMKQGGAMLITGKNDNYHPEDSEAFVAERNARLKNFPNHFTDVKLLTQNLVDFGFELQKLYVFPFRGDFGKNQHAFMDVLPEYFYEYLMIVKKIGEAGTTDYKICESFSKVALKKAAEAAFTDMDLFFKDHQEKYSS